MLEDVPAITLPPRSQLFSLPMEGTGGGDQESILDYAQRLSLEHRVRVRDMFSRIILPEAGIRGAFFIPGYFSDHAVRGCNGWSGYAHVFLGAMQRLTGRLDLSMGSMSAWADMLSVVGYVAKTRRWCPPCLREQRSRGFHTFHLAWAFEPVRVCPIHQVWLCEKCHRCGSPQPVIGDRLATGLCNRCGAHLSEISPKVAPETQFRSEWYGARAVAGMIGLHRRAPSLISAQHVSQRWQEVADAECRGSLYRLERSLHLSHGVLSGRGKHSLAFFLEMVRRLGVEPATFLDASCRAAQDPQACAAPSVPTRRLSTEDRATIAKRLRQGLHQALSQSERLTTRLELIRDLGISNSYLGMHHPDVVRELRSHNDQIRPAVRRALWDRRRDAIDAAMRGLVDGGGPFTAARIAAELASIGLHRRHPEVRRIAYEALGRAQRETVNSQAQTRI